MKIGILFGTRPEIIKLYSIIKFCEKNKLNYFLIHSNQHFSPFMDKVFLEEFKIPSIKYNLNIFNCPDAEMIGKMLIKLDKILKLEKPNLLIVQGDTNTTLAGALSSVKNKVKLVHVEAGLRSFDKSMPEEINRIICDHISNFLFAPTKIQKKILLKEGIKKEIYVVGNTIVDTLIEFKNLINKNYSFKKKYFLITLHRAENVDNKEKLKKIISYINLIKRLYNVEIIFPIHPRTQKRMREYNLNLKDIRCIPPLGYLHFLRLEKNAEIILTDSGGVQEEACILRVPCLTLRENTERPETIIIGSNILVGIDKYKIINGINYMLKKKRCWSNPYGKGDTGQKIMLTLLSSIK